MGGMLKDVEVAYQKEAKRRHCNAADGLDVAAWRNIIREAMEKYKGTDGDIAETFLQADTNKDNVLTFDEFKECMMKPHLDKSKLDDVEKLFKAWDKNNDCKLTQDEVRQAVGKYRPETIERILQEADQDGDCLISVKEFKAKLFGV